MGNYLQRVRACYVSTFVMLGDYEGHFDIRTGGKEPESVGFEVTVASHAVVYTSMWRLLAVFYR